MTRRNGSGRRRGTVIGALVALLLAAAAPRLVAQAKPPAPVALAHVTLIDGTGAPARPHMTVIIRNGRIAAVQPDGARLPDGATVEDLTGRFLVPGLIDAHVHITGRPTTFEQDPDAARRTAAARHHRPPRHGGRRPHPVVPVA